MRVLLTRPRDDAEATARRLAEIGIDSVVAPLIDITYIEDATIDLRGVQAVMVTSANGVRALAQVSPRRDIAIYAVGDASADAARQAGFTEVASAGGDVGALAALAGARLDPQAGAVVHVAGSAVAGDLMAELSQRGFSARRVQLYRAQAVSALPEAARAALRDSAVDAVLFYSPRTAGRFADLVAVEGFERDCAGLTAICLSDNVAAALGDVPFAEIRVAAQLNEDAMFDVLVSGC